MSPGADSNQGPTSDRSDPFWNETSFNGASVSFSGLVSADDHYGAAVAFLKGGCARLNG